MRKLVAALGVGVALGLAAPAYADPSDITGDDGAFLAALAQVGIRYANPAAAVAAGKSACECLNKGEAGLELVHDLKTHNAGFSMEEASDFAMIAAKYYCPQQLSKS